MSFEFQKRLAQRKKDSLYNPSAKNAVTRQIPGYHEMLVYQQMVLDNTARNDGPRLTQHIMNMWNTSTVYYKRSEWANRVATKRGSKL